MRYSNAHRLTAFLFGVSVLMIAGVASAGMCKWVDENGCVHYAETCPEGVAGTEVQIQPPPSQEQVTEADKQSASWKEIKKERESSKRSKSEMQTSAGRSLAFEELGPLPENNTSVYLTTLGADYTINARTLMGQFCLRLQARDNLARGAFLEAHFPDPDHTNKIQIVGKELRREGANILILSPKSAGFKCWNYEIEVFVYQDDSKEELLDIHRQTIQSRVDLSLAKNAEDLIEGMLTGGLCPSAHQRDMKKMTVKQLEALCEREREKYLKPEREALIERCIKRGEKQDEWCENFYADWGDAQRLDINTVRPALYYNLPECVAAKEAREKAQR